MFKLIDLQKSCRIVAFPYVPLSMSSNVSILNNHRIIIMKRKLMLVKYELNLDIIHILPNFPLIAFFYLGSYPGLYITFQLFFFHLLQSVTVHQSFLPFMSLTVVKSIDQLFYIMSLHLGFSIVFS